MSTLIPLSTNEDRRSFFKGESWNYIGLEAELPNRGDYRQTFVGETSVIVVRDREDSIHVLINRCSHCGAKVCHNAHGNTKVFVCTYHEWVFNLKGDLRGVPFKKGIDGQGGMADTFDPNEHGMTRLNVTVRNGVIFASHSFSLPPFKRYLDPVILYYFDRVCSGRPLKVLDKMCHLVNSNWKLQVENGKDPFHAALLHSFFKNFGIWRSDQETHVELYQSGAHSLLVSTTSFKAQQEADTTPKVRLKASQLIDHQREFEHGTGAIMTVFPNLIFLQQLNCLAMRHVILDGSDACIKEWIFFGYTDEPEALIELRLHQANLLDPAGLVTIDDNEILAVT
ncbi:Rieske 2Fe-2S domain-containing protein [Candidatus Enterovibrio escicola]|uniref:Rieske 2Fe-2S domain-containing protein n=1 Tax=Candidatus Enterovibrio escicola TaxID=1927127 RepID=UPI001238188E|nr:Rieske 2Fe-2S domain-containing protein [Candidatus Enterovibrio escacola]